MLIGKSRNGHAHEDRRSGSRRRLDLQSRADEGGAFAHADEAECVPRRFGSRVESSTVVFDDKQDIAAPTFENDLDVACLRMLRNVRQRFLRDAIERSLGICRQSFVEQA